MTRLTESRSVPSRSVAPPNRAEKTVIAVLLVAALGVWAWCGFPLTSNDVDRAPQHQTP